MNEFLAQLYGTAETVGAAGDDTEKLAQAQIMNEMFEAEGIDVDSLAPETIVKVAEALFGDQTKIAEEDVKKEDEEDEEEEEEGEEEKKEAQEKLAEADFLGRVMAHSYVNEMAEIEKEAGALSRGAGAIERLGGRIKGKGKDIREAFKAGREWKRTRAMGTVSATGKKGPKGHKMYLPREKTTGVKATLGGLGEVARKHPGTVAGGAALGLAGLGAGGYGVHKAMKKKESALDVLAEQRAMEILAENGVGTGEEKLASAVEQRAYEMLVEAGYIE